jgi:methylase of polypeptide subunit release factors
MTDDDLTQLWATQFGLALTPLFANEKAAAGSHSVLLDGGFGSFALSVSDKELWRRERTADWAWSSNLPHHVTVTDKEVAVTRWDRRQVEILSRPSVEAQIESFYSYLTNDRVRSTNVVVDYVLSLFRRVRSLVAIAEMPDNRSVDAFLAFLSLLIEVSEPVGGTPAIPSNLCGIGEGKDLLRALPSNGVESLLQEVRERTSPQSLRLLPSLAVRHAGSEIFQEAHFELLRAPGMDLFGYAGPAETAAITRGGAHFTPAALARSVVEQTLLQVEGLASRTRLIVLDPACGSGAFLQEALRALRRLEFAGGITLVGRDISPAAISMAKFAIGHAALDWSPKGGTETDIRIADSLTDSLPPADVILMNPPFLAWSALDDHQREQVRAVLGDRIQGRSDLSMAFVTRSVDLLTSGGALGVLIPSSLLTLQAAEKWRADLLERTELRLLASLGDYGLFAHALIQIAAAVFAKPSGPAKGSEKTVALVTNNSAESTGNALRSLRMARGRDRETGEEHAWHIFEVTRAHFRRRPTWRLTSPGVEAALARLLDAGASRVNDLFEVRQGVRTGDNKAFLLNQHSLQTLPSRERRFFKPALMNDSIQDGQLRDLYRIFYPYDESGPLFATERDLLEAVPQYANRYLLPLRDKLAGRSSLTRSNRQDWWALSWERSRWALDPKPRIVSKYFGGPGGFAVDLDASFIIVQGFAWFLKASEPPDIAGQVDTGLDEQDLLCAYAGMMNSRPFGRLLELFSSHVAGGQFDLSPRYVDQIPIPNLSDLSRDERAGRLISKLAYFGRESRLADPDWEASTTRITTELYGIDIFEQV